VIIIRLLPYPGPSAQRKNGNPHNPLHNSNHPNGYSQIIQPPPNKISHPNTHHYLSLKLRQNCQELDLFPQPPPPQTTKARCHGRPLRPPFLPSNPKNGVVNHRLHDHSTPMQRRFMQPQKKKLPYSASLSSPYQDCQGVQLQQLWFMLPSTGKPWGPDIIGFLEPLRKYFPQAGPPG
jgi:hypothetical protein